MKKNIENHFYNLQELKEQKLYCDLLSAASSLSRIFSENDAPYLSSRSVENIFCYAFGSENLSRTDCSVDAKHGNIGIGIKTFLHNSGNTLQKIAEFNKDINLYNNQNDEDTIRIIAKLRNERLMFTIRTYSLQKIIYHCVTRHNSILHIFEETMDLIDIKNICNIRNTGASIQFDDGINEYSFHKSKSTLFKRFKTESPLISINIKIIDDPFLVIMGLLKLEESVDSVISSKISIPTINSPKALEYVILPLYSMKNGEKYVYAKSGLNQWNASGRARDFDEVYIQIKKIIHRKFPDFFPPRDQAFNLILPNGNIMSAKVCQDESKALMSNPNKSLGYWILREVLNLKPGELADYSRLKMLGVDSVKISKKDNHNFYIDFCETDAFEEFEEIYL